MAHTGEQKTTTLKAASIIGAHLPVFLPIASSRDRVGVLAAAVTDPVLGLTRATGASVGNTIPVVLGGDAKAIAAASLGAGAWVGVASTNGALGPIGPSGMVAHVGSGGAVSPKFRVGIAMKAAVAGEIFTVYVDPQQIL